MHSIKLWIPCNMRHRVKRALWVLQTFTAGVFQAVESIYFNSTQLVWWLQATRPGLSPTVSAWPARWGRPHSSALTHSCQRHTTVIQYLKTSLSTPRRPHSLTHTYKHWILHSLGCIREEEEEWERMSTEVNTNKDNQNFTIFLSMCVREAESVWICTCVRGRSED